MNFLKYIAKTERTNQHPLGEKGTEILLHHFPKNPIKVLEIGCGTGHTAAIITNRLGTKYYGLDTSKWMLKAAKNRAQNLSITSCTFELSTTNNYNFEDNFFDVVFCESVLAIQPLQEFDTITQEIYRILKKDGLFLANESIWKENISNPRIKEINTKMYSKYGLVQAEGGNNKKNWKTILVKNKLNIEKFKLLSTIKEAPNFNNNTSYNKSKKYTLLKKKRSFLNPINIFYFIYFKILDFKFKEIGIHIESFLIVCKK